MFRPFWVILRDSYITHETSLRWFISILQGLHCNVPQTRHAYNKYHTLSVDRIMSRHRRPPVITTYHPNIPMTVFFTINLADGFLRKLISVILGAFAELRKATISFVMSVWLSA